MLDYIYYYIIQSLGFATTCDAALPLKLNSATTKSQRAKGEVAKKDSARKYFASKIGEHSGDKDVKRKIIKLKICGELLAWLAGELGANLINLTSHGEPIPNVPDGNVTFKT